YDELTFRLVQLKTARAHDHALLQDLKYTYDPIGNITSIEDHAQQTVCFDNQVVSASNEYVYDAIYRLIEAHGRELIGLVARPEVDWNDEPRMNQPLPGDGQAMRRYKENYHYDPVGNILALIHHAADGSWRRHYDYPEFSNRLERTHVGELEEHYAYDANGNMVRMPHLPVMNWDFKNQLHVTRRQVVNEGHGQRTFYVYDSGGQRVRKITERPDGSRAHERIYLGGFEIYREYDRSKVALERETLHVTDDKRRIALVEIKTIDIKAQPNHLPHVLIRYQFTNHLDSSSLELDEEAAIISYEEYYPYGSTSYEAVRRVVEVSPKRYRFTGQERDEETGLYYCELRYYASWLGRWTAPDPEGLTKGTNLFVYCSDNPITLRDPGGTDDEPVSTPAEEEAQACLIDPSTPEPTATEESAQACLPSEHLPASQAALPTPAASSAVGRTIAPPPVSPPDTTLYVPQGFAYSQYAAASREAANPENSWGARIGFGILEGLSAPLALAEEYIARPIVNIPYTVENAGIGIGEHLGRAYLWAQQGEYGEATVDVLSSVVDFSGGFNAAASVATPIAGAFESRATSAASSVQSQITEVTTTNARVNQLVNVAESGDVTWVAGNREAAAAYSDAMAAARSSAGGREGFSLLRGRLGTRMQLNGPIHHWRFPLSLYSGEALSAENLYLTEGSSHLALHRAMGTTTAPFSSMAWGAEPEIQSMFNFWNTNTSVPANQVISLLPK
ncbi:MAG TPA: RHS repeat-associated core domain-containing protein, partial [Bryocella sp.]|nr:RHS repeat-associated core domain-containing protein [Bryocella sp.]